MTSDLETTTDDLYATIRELWQQAQPATGGDLDAPAGFGQAVVSIPDTAIAEATGLDLTAVREFLHNADGVKLVVETDGEARSVKALIG
jgi:hypothetical protein